MRVGKGFQLPLRLKPMPAVMQSKSTGPVLAYIFLQNFLLMKTGTVLTILSIPLFACCTTLSPDHIKGHQWLYGGGYRIGDKLQFDNKSFSFHGDTILKSDLPVAVVVMTSGDLLGSNNDITIQSLATGEEGLYHEK
jgi:hypothetical protein